MRRVLRLNRSHNLEVMRSNRIPATITNKAVAVSYDCYRLIYLRVGMSFGGCGEAGRNGKGETVEQEIRQAKRS